MPRGDGTGPGGMGPMSGRAAGYCAGYNMPGYANQVPGRGFGGRGGGRGMGRGFGRGMGWGRGFSYPNAVPYAEPYAPYPASPAYPYNPVVTPQQEAQMLKDEAKAMQAGLKSINDRIAELEKAAKEEKK